MKKLWSNGTLLGIAALVLAGVAYYSWQKSLPPEMPAEIRAVRGSFDKVTAALEVGVPYTEYNRLLIETKAAINAAAFKMPEITDAEAQAFDTNYNRDVRTELGMASRAMSDAMDLHSQALFVWGAKVRGQRLWDTPEGSKIRWDHKFAATMTEDEILQELWAQAKLKVSRFKTGTNAYRQSS